MGTFPKEELEKALTSADGRCECRRTNKDCLKKHYLQDVMKVVLR